MKTSITTLTYRDVPLAVEFLYYPPRRGAREYGLALEPDCHEDVEIERVLAGGADITQLFDADEIAELEQLVLAGIRQARAA